MGCKLNLSSPPLTICKFQPNTPELRTKTLFFSSSSSSSSLRYKLPNIRYSSTDLEVPSTEAKSYTINFRTERDCKLGISRYPDFEYNAEGGSGTGCGAEVTDNLADNELFVSFDLDTLYIPPLTSSTTKFLGLPLPPFLKIDIVPLAFQGSINKESGKVINMKSLNNNKVKLHRELCSPEKKICSIMKYFFSNTQYIKKMFQKYA